MLGEPDDLRGRSGRELGQGDELRVLLLFDLRVDRPAVRAAVGLPETIVDPLDHLVGERVAELVRMDVRLRGRVAHEVREEPLDDAVLADDAVRALRALRREDRLLLLTALDEAVGLEPLQHLSGRRT